MDISDSCSQEIDSQICNHLAFIRICTFTTGDSSVFFSSDSTYLSFYADSFSMCKSNNFFCFFNILGNRV